MIGDYLALLRQWGRTLNLTSRRDAMGQLEEHVATSLSLVEHIPAGATCLTDLGSGQGFPAVPLAIVTGIAVSLVEADRRKAAFLTTVLARLRLVGTVWPMRIEVARVPPVECVTARALAPLATLIDLARPFLLPQGCCLFLKSASAAAELEAARAVATFDAVILPVGKPPSCLVKVTALG